MEPFKKPKLDTEEVGFLYSLLQITSERQKQPSCREEIQAFGYIPDIDAEDPEMYEGGADSTSFFVNLPKDIIMTGLLAFNEPLEMLVNAISCSFTTKINIKSCSGRPGPSSERSSSSGRKDDASRRTPSLTESTRRPSDIPRNSAYGFFNRTNEKCQGRGFARNEEENISETDDNNVMSSPNADESEEERNNEHIKRIKANSSNRFQRTILEATARRRNGSSSRHSIPNSDSFQILKDDALFNKHFVKSKIVRTASTPKLKRKDIAILNSATSVSSKRSTSENAKKTRERSSMKTQSTQAFQNEMLKKKAEFSLLKNGKALRGNTLMPAVSHLSKPSSTSKLAVFTTRKEPHERQEAVILPKKQQRETSQSVVNESIPHMEENADNHCQNSSQKNGLDFTPLNQIQSNNGKNESLNNLVELPPTSMNVQEITPHEQSDPEMDVQPMPYATMGLVEFQQNKIATAFPDQHHSSPESQVAFVSSENPQSNLQQQSHPSFQHSQQPAKGNTPPNQQQPQNFNERSQQSNQQEKQEEEQQTQPLPPEIHKKQSQIQKLQDELQKKLQKHTEELETLKQHHENQKQQLLTHLQQQPPEKQSGQIERQQHGQIQEQLRLVQQQKFQQHQLQNEIERKKLLLNQQRHQKHFQPPNSKNTYASEELHASQQLQNNLDNSPEIFSSPVPPPPPPPPPPYPKQQPTFMQSPQTYPIPSTSLSQQSNTPISNPPTTSSMPQAYQQGPSPPTLQQSFPSQNGHPPRLPFPSQPRYYFNPQSPMQPIIPPTIHNGARPLLSSSSSSSSAPSPQMYNDSPQSSYNNPYHTSPMGPPSQTNGNFHSSPPEAPNHPPAAYYPMINCNNSPLPPPPFPTHYAVRLPSHPLELLAMQDPHLYEQYMMNNQQPWRLMYNGSGPGNVSVPPSGYGYPLSTGDQMRPEKLPPAPRKRRTPSKKSIPPPTQVSHPIMTQLLRQPPPPITLQNQQLMMQPQLQIQHPQHPHIRGAIPFHGAMISSHQPNLPVPSPMSNISNSPQTPFISSPFRAQHPQSSPQQQIIIPLRPQLQQRSQEQAIAISPFNKKMPSSYSQEQALNNFNNHQPVTAQQQMVQNYQNYQSNVSFPIVATNQINDIDPSSQYTPVNNRLNNFNIDLMDKSAVLNVPSSGTKINILPRNPNINYGTQISGDSEYNNLPLTPNRDSLHQPGSSELAANSMNNMEASSMPCPNPNYGSLEDELTIVDEFLVQESVQRNSNSNSSITQTLEDNNEHEAVQNLASELSAIEFFSQNSVTSSITTNVERMEEHHLGEHEVLPFINSNKSGKRLQSIEDDEIPATKNKKRKLGPRKKKTQDVDTRLRNGIQIDNNEMNEKFQRLPNPKEFSPEKDYQQNGSKKVINEDSRKNVNVAICEEAVSYTATFVAPEEEQEVIYEHVIKQVNNVDGINFDIDINILEDEKNEVENNGNEEEMLLADSDGNNEDSDSDSDVEMLDESESENETDTQNYAPSFEDMLKDLGSDVVNDEDNILSHYAANAGLNVANELATLNIIRNEIFKTLYDSTIFNALEQSALIDMVNGTVDSQISEIGKRRGLAIQAVEENQDKSPPHDIRVDQYLLDTVMPLFASALYRTETPEATKISKKFRRILLVIALNYGMKPNKNAWHAIITMKLFTTKKRQEIFQQLLNKSINNFTFLDEYFDLVHDLFNITELAIVLFLKDFQELTTKNDPLFGEVFQNALRRMNELTTPQCTHLVLKFQTRISQFSKMFENSTFHVEACEFISTLHWDARGFRQSNDWIANQTRLQSDSIHPKLENIFKETMKSLEDSGVIEGKTWVYNVSKSAVKSKFMKDMIANTNDLTEKKQEELFAVIVPTFIKLVISVPHLFIAADCHHTLQLVPTIFEDALPILKRAAAGADEIMTVPFMPFAKLMQICNNSSLKNCENIIKEIMKLYHHIKSASSNIPAAIQVERRRCSNSIYYRKIHPEYVRLQMNNSDMNKFKDEKKNVLDIKKLHKLISKLFSTSELEAPLKNIVGIKDGNKEAISIEKVVCAEIVEKCGKVFETVLKSVPIQERVEFFIDHPLLNEKMDIAGLITLYQLSQDMLACVTDFLGLMSLPKNTVLGDKSQPKYFDIIKLRRNAIYFYAMKNSAFIKKRLSIIPPCILGKDEQLYQILEAFFADSDIVRNVCCPNNISAFLYFALVMSDIPGVNLNETSELLFTACNLKNGKVEFLATKNFLKELEIEILRVMNSELDRTIKEVISHVSSPGIPRITIHELSKTKSKVNQLRCLVIELVITFWNPHKLLTGIGRTLECRKNVEQCLKEFGITLFSGFFCLGKRQILLSELEDMILDDLSALQGGGFQPYGDISFYGFVLNIQKLFELQSLFSAVLVVLYLYFFSKEKSFYAARLTLAKRVAQEPFLLKIFGLKNSDLTSIGFVNQRNQKSQLEKLFEDDYILVKGEGDPEIFLTFLNKPFNELYKQLDFVLESDCREIKHSFPFHVNMERDRYHFPTLKSGYTRELPMIPAKMVIEKATKEVPCNFHYFSSSGE